jgi:hypothetical protein
MSLAPRRVRHVLIALPRDAAEAAATLRWTCAHVKRDDDDLFTLLHVRLTDFTSPAPAPLLARDEPLSALGGEFLSGTSRDEDLSAALDAAKALGPEAKVRLVKLSSPLRVLDALVAYMEALPEAERAEALVLGSHKAARDAPYGTPATSQAWCAARARAVCAGARACLCCARVRACAACSLPIHA